MQALRNHLSLTRLVLAWFMLTLGIAAASPIMHPMAMEVLCSGSGSKQVVFIDKHGEAMSASQHALDCPLCLAVAPPPPQPLLAFEQPQPLGLALHPVVSARIAALVGAPFPPRGPPALV